MASVDSHEDQGFDPHLAAMDAEPGENAGIDFDPEVARSATEKFHQAPSDGNVVTTTVLETGDNTTVAFETGQVDRVETTDRPGWFKLVFKEMGEHNTEIAIAATAVSFVALGACLGAFQYRRRKDFDPTSRNLDPSRHTLPIKIIRQKRITK